MYANRKPRNSFFWQAAWIAGTWALERRRRRRTHGGHTPAQVYQVMQPWFTAHIFDIGHKCYDQLTHIKITSRKRPPLLSD